jgi:hypothetical protein
MKLSYYWTSKISEKEASVLSSETLSCEVEVFCYNLLHPSGVNNNIKVTFIYKKTHCIFILKRNCVYERKSICIFWEYKENQTFSVNYVTLLKHVVDIVTTARQR